ncbi:MAG: multicopper oxidase domain-containing protein [Flavobacteriales bacterium]|nr:multicopper oxidase domain-containing protein [Flavobacteriales bacterium]MBK9193672.1 multicopper oxidase domain-containing protein [Flavobacteriales bacterium]
MNSRIVLLLSLFPSAVLAQNPLAIPPAFDVDTFHLVVDEHVHQFYPGINTNTYGASAEYLGPTLVFHTNDTACIRVHNDLAQITNMHWHGLHVPAEFDGGPPREIAPGGAWDVKFQVKNPAGTYWYHPHPHELTAEQANMGIAGFIIVQDDDEAALDLPRTYGVDDFPIVVQDRRFQANGSFVFGPFGDSVLVNGTPRPYLECPAQVVRLRLLNGSNARIYPLGFENNHPFSVIASDGGLLNAPVTMDRIPLSNGERAEILLDLTGMEGDSLLLMSYGSELPATVPGSSFILWEGSALNGIDFPVLRIRITAPTTSPVTAVPAALGTALPLDEALATNTRTKVLSGNGMVGMGMFYINGQMFDLNVINDTIQLGAMEIWEIENISNMAHPFHIHGGSFYILDRDGIAPPLWEQGAKDVVLVDAGAGVRVIMRFDDYITDGWPFMYHCHNLLHEDNMMMAQYIVVDQNVAVVDVIEAPAISVFPSPTSSSINYSVPFAATELRLFDGNGRAVVHLVGPIVPTGAIDLGGLPSGPYMLVVNSRTQVARTVVMKE